MKSSSDVLRETMPEDLQQQPGPEPEGRQRSIADWTGELLLGIRQPVQFRLADWP